MSYARCGNDAVRSYHQSYIGHCTNLDSRYSCLIYFFRYHCAAASACPSGGGQDYSRNSLCGELVRYTFPYPFSVLQDHPAAYSAIESIMQLSDRSLFLKIVHDIDWNYTVRVLIPKFRIETDVDYLIISSIQTPNILYAIRTKPCSFASLDSVRITLWD